MKTKIHSCARLFALLCVLMLCAGQMYGQYYQARAQVISEDGNIGGSVYIGGYSAGEYQSPTFTTAVSQVNSSGDIDIYLYAQAAEGFVFNGWYKDESCTIQLKTDNKYNFWSYGTGYFKVETSDSDQNPPVTTFYAKFEKRYVPDFIWTPYGEAPVEEGRYYIYNTANYRFLKAPSTSALEKEEATVFIFSLVSNESGFDYINLSYDDNGEVKYVKGNNSSWSSSVYNCRLIANEGDKYCITEDYGISYANHLQMNGDGTISYPYGSSRGDGIYWVFIPCEECKHTLYYAANSETNKGGSVKVSFENPVPSEALSIAQSSMTSFEASVPVTAYFKAVPADGYEFVGWKKSPAGEYVSYDVDYSDTFDASSTEETSPTTFTMYAYFEKESEYEAELFDANGNSTTGTFADRYAAAGNGYSIVLYKNIDLGSTPLTIDKNITIDFNNRAFTGTISNLVAIASGKTVTFADNSSEATGGVRVSANTNAEVTAVQVTGTLKFYGGVIKSENASEESEAKATGLTVASSGALELKGGKIEAKANSNAYGVKNEGTAALTTGSINATAAAGAYGVLTNGTTNITSIVR